MRTPLTRDLLTDLYLTRGLSVREVADQTGYSQTAVRNALAEAGIPRRPRGGVSRSQGLTAQVLAECYHTQGASVADIATQAGVSEATVLRAMRRTGVATDPSRQHASRYADALTAAALTDALGRMSAAAYARQVGCSAQTVRAAARRHGLRLTRAAERLELSAAELRYAYLVEGLSLRAIAERAQTSRARVAGALDRLGMPRPAQLRAELPGTDESVREALVAVLEATAGGTGDARLGERVWALLALR